MAQKSDDPNRENFKRDPGKETEIKRDSRRQRALERLGVPNPRCIFCSEGDPLCLEVHHIQGRSYGDETVIVCRNDHRKLSALQKDHPEKIQVPPDPLEKIAHFLLGAADLFELLIKKLREFARDLIEHADPNRDNLEPRQ